MDSTQKKGVYAEDMGYRKKKLNVNGNLILTESLSREVQESLDVLSNRSNQYVTFDFSNNFIITSDCLSSVAIMAVKSWFKKLGYEIDIRRIECNKYVNKKGDGTN